MTKIKRNKGFTLIELLVVIAIIGILSSIVVASLNTARKKSRDTRRVADIKQIQLALEMYFDANRKYSTGITDALLSPTYIAKVPVPPTGTGQTVYSYAVADGTGSDPVYYHLGATLEETTNQAFSSDRDCDSTIAGTTCGGGEAYAAGGTAFNGINGTCAENVGTDSCYDVVN